MSFRYPDLSDYFAVAAEVTGLDIRVVIASAKVDLADSALRAPSASFGGDEFYPDFCDKAGVLLERVTKNHPLLDGNKREELPPCHKNLAWALMYLSRRVAPVWDIIASPLRGGTPDIGRSFKNDSSKAT